MLFQNRKSYLLHIALILALLGGMFGVVPIERVQAATLMVTNLTDGSTGSLRHAIAVASPGDSITFDPSLAGGVVQLSSPLLINKDLTIDGSGLSSHVVLSGENSFGIIEIISFANVTISDITFTNGFSTSGGAIENDAGTLTILNSIFSGNAASGNGGAIYSFGQTLTVLNSTFSGNNAGGNGGAIYGSGLTLKNSTIYQNQAQLSGGAIFFSGNSISTIVNSTLRQNQASSGGGIAATGNSYIKVFNSTFAGNIASGGSEVDIMGNVEVNLFNTILACAPEINSCIIQSATTTISSPSSIIATETLADLGLAELADNGGTTQTMALLAGSPLIDAGNDVICANSLVNNLDQRGVARPQNDHCDIGAYEYQPLIHYVKWNANGANNGTSWTDAYTDLQSALLVASSGEEIWVAAGTYKPTTTADRFVSFTMKDGVRIYGGFAGTESALIQRDASVNVTTLSGDIGNPGNNNDNSYHVVVGSHTNNSALLDGFTVIAGNANESAYSLDESKGGGIYNDSGSPTIRNVIFSSNYGTFGGGMYNGGEFSFPNGSSPILTNLTFINNSAVEGGGMRNEDYSSPTLTNLVFTGNSVIRAGGGMQNFHFSSPAITNVAFNGNTASIGAGMMNVWNSEPILVNVTFDTNAAADWGGGMDNERESKPILTNVTFSGNSAPSGGGMSNIHSYPTITNVTFSGNSAATQGGAIHNNQSNPIVRNTILWGNNAPAGAQVYDHFNSVPAVSDSVVQGGYASGTNIITADPLLGTLGNYGGFTETIPLQAGSSAINQGYPFYCPSTDQRGVARPQGDGCDMGAFEYIETPTPTFTPSPIPTFTPTFVPTNTPTATSTPAISPTPVTSCDQITTGPITISGNAMSMSIMNPLTVPVQIQDIFVVWNHDKGYMAGSDKTLQLRSVNLGSQIWSGTSSGPSHTIIPSPAAFFIPIGTSSITFTFHQPYENLDGTEEILINLSTNGCQAYPIHSTSIATNTPTPTPTHTHTSTPTPSLTPTNTFTPTVTPPYSYNPLYISLTGNQTIGGIASADEDILRFDGTTWSLFFDGSDVGVGSSDLFGFSIVDSDTILMAFSSAVTVNGISALPQDVLRFDATSLGTNTAGTFSMYLNGIDVGLDVAAEKIDAVSLLLDGRMLISTTGNPAVPGVSGAKDEDVLAFSPTTLGSNTSGSWTMYFDGSDVGLAETSGEDVDALDVVNGKVYLSTADNFAVNGIAGADEDVFVCEFISLGDVTACNYSPTLYFDGSTWNLSANDVDAFNLLAIGLPPTVTPTVTQTPGGPTVTPTHTLTPSHTPTPTNTATTGPSPTFTNTPTATPTSTATYTPTFTNTPGGSDMIFADGFESGTLAAWTSNTNDAEDLSASPAAALVGSQGLQAVIDDANTIYVTDDTPNAEPRYRVRFYFDPNTITMASNDAHHIFKGFMGTSTEVLRLEFRNSAGAYQLRAAVLNDGTTWSNTNWFTISDTSHFIELDWRAAAGVGANNVGLTLWIDGIQQADLTGVDNDTRRMDRARLGALTGTDIGTRGVYSFDAFESRRQMYIGPAITTPTPTVTPTVGSGSAHVEVYAGGVLLSASDIPSQTTVRPIYGGINNGPLRVISTNGVPIIASERFAYNNGSTWISHSELMGLPSNQVSTSYYFPWYDNVDFNSQLLIGNVGTSSTVVTVTVAGVVKGTYSIAPLQSQQISYSGLDSGPVRVESSGARIIASLGVGDFNGSVWTSHSELMGLPQGQLATSYMFPWYNNVEINSQLRFGNVGNTTTTVTVTVGGVVQGSYTLGPNESQQVSYAGLSNGPVKVESSNGVPIVVSKRFAYLNGSTWTNHSETMGLPTASLSTKYVLPIYDSVNHNSQISFVNVGNSATTVTITINGTQMSSHSIAPNETIRVSYAPMNSGPVVVQSSGGVPIMVSERVRYNNGSAITNFSELIGLPFHQLSTDYFFPWYNDVNLDTQLRIGVP